MLKISGECKCGSKRDIECDDQNTLQKLKDAPCTHCGGKLKYKTDNEDVQND